MERTRRQLGRVHRWEYAYPGPGAVHSLRACVFALHFRRGGRCMFFLRVIACAFQLPNALNYDPACISKTHFLPDVLLLSVLHDDDGARQWYRVLRLRGADDDTEGAHTSQPLKKHPIIYFSSPCVLLSRCRYLRPKIASVTRLDPRYKYLGRICNIFVVLSRWMLDFLCVLIVWLTQVLHVVRWQIE